MNGGSKMNQAERTLLFNQANHFEEYLAKRINKNKTFLNYEVIKAARETSKEYEKKLPDINIQTLQRPITLEVKQDSLALRTGNIFIEETTIKQQTFDYLLQTSGPLYWEGNETKHFLFVFTKQQLEQQVKTIGHYKTHAGDKTLYKLNGGWTIPISAIHYKYENEELYNISKEYLIQYHQELNNQRANIKA